MKLNPPNAHRSRIKICEKRQTRNVQFRFMQNAFRILKPIQKSSKCVWVFRNTGANAFAKNQTCLAYEDKRDLYCSHYTTGRQSMNCTNMASYSRQNSILTCDMPFVILICSIHCNIPLWHAICYFDSQHAMLHSILPFNIILTLDDQEPTFLVLHT